MKFIKKIFISLSIVVLLFCSIFLSPKSDDYFKDTKVEASAVATIPLFALNPELIPVFLFGVFVLAVCGVVVNNVDKIVAAGNQLKQTIEEAGDSVDKFIENSKYLIVNEAFKRHVLNTVERMSKTRYSTGTYKFNNAVASNLSTTDLGVVGLNGFKDDDYIRNNFINASIGTGTYYPLISFRPLKQNYDSSGRVISRDAYLIELADNAGGVIKNDALRDVFYNASVPTSYYIKPVTSISVSFNHVIPAVEDGSYQIVISYLNLVEYENGYSGIDADEENFTIDLFDTVPLTLQRLASHGIIYDPKVDAKGNILSFSLTILKSFADWRPKYKYITSVGIDSMDFVGSGFKLNALEANGPITINDYSGSVMKDRAISYPNVKLLANAYDKATIAKSLDIAFPNTLDNLVPLDNVFTADREIDNLMELDGVLDASARFLDEASTRGLDNVLTHASTLDLAGIEEGVADKVLVDTFDARAYALDNVRVATAGVGSIPAVIDDTANAGAIPKDKTEADWISKVPFLGQLWDFLKEIIRLLNAILKGILDAIINAIKAAASPILNVLNALFEVIKSIAKGRSIAETITQDLVIGNTDALVAKLNNIQQLINAKFPNIVPLNLNFTDKPAFDDFTADIPYAGTVTIISADMMNRFAPVAKNFFAGLFYFLTGLFFFKKYYKVSEG